jgi:alanine racemase
MRVRPTEAVVELAAITRNYALACEVGGRPAIAVVKANAYGHGAIPVARALVQAGCPMLAVALVEEGIELREAGIAAPILVLGGAYGDRYDLLVSHRLTPLVFRAEQVAALGEAARQLGTSAAAHLKLDTGMGRIGVSPLELGAFMAAARAARAVRLEGICTHFASADLVPREVTERQVRLFEEASSALEAEGFPVRFRHLANSAGTIEFPATRQDLTRPGIMLYGLLPFAAGDALSEAATAVGAVLSPALTWKTAITHVKTVPAGTPISYGGRWSAQRTSRIATLPVGYADGYSRRLSGRPGFGMGEVLVRGRRAPIAGTVCMDMMMVDVTDIAGADVGDETVLIGEQGEQRISADELAARAGTISYEILCGISHRVPRRYV